MTSDQGAGIIREFDHWTLRVSDLERASAFYEEVLGWRPLDSAAEPDDELWGALPGAATGPVRTRRFVRDGQRIELAESSGGEWRVDPRPQVNHLGFSHMTVATGPADQTLAALRSHGVRVREHSRSSFVPDLEHPGNQFLFEDPDGNLVETYEAGEDWSAFAGTGASDGGGNSFGIAHLSHWSLCIADPATALPFYENVLAWQELAALTWEGPGPSCVMDVGPAELTTWLFAAGDQRIEIIHFAVPGVVARPGSGVAATGLSHMTVVVDDVPWGTEGLTAAGAEPVITKGSAGESVVFRDPDGNLIRGVPVPPVWY